MSCDLFDNAHCVSEPHEEQLYSKTNPILQCKYLFINLDVVDVGLQIPYHVDECFQKMWHCFLVVIAHRVGYAESFVAEEEEEIFRVLRNSPSSSWG